MQIQLNSQERNWGKRETSTSLFEIEKIKKIVPIYEFKFSIHDVVLIVSRRKIRKCLKKNNNFMAPFYGWCSTASRLQPLRGGSLPFPTQFPEIPGTHFTDLGRMKG